VESWLRKKIGLIAFWWFTYGYLVTLISSGANLAASNLPGIGASVWALSFAAVVVAYLANGKIQLRSKPISELVPSLLAGSAVISPLGYVTDVITGFRYYSLPFIGNDIGHVIAFVAATVAAYLVLRISARRHDSDP
jgi:hypothetical protein